MLSVSMGMTSTSLNSLITTPDTNEIELSDTPISNCCTSDISPTEIQVQTQTNKSNKCKTNLGSTLLKILQNKPLVMKFDELRAELKKQKGKKNSQTSASISTIKLEIQNCLTRCEAQTQKFRPILLTELDFHPMQKITQLISMVCFL